MNKAEEQLLRSLRAENARLRQRVDGLEEEVRYWQGAFEEQGKTEEKAA